LRAVKIAIFRDSAYKNAILKLRPDYAVASAKQEE